MSDAPRYGKEAVEDIPKGTVKVGVTKFPGTLGQATKKAALSAIEKKKEKKAAAGKAQGETTVAESE